MTTWDFVLLQNGCLQKFIHIFTDCFWEIDEHINNAEIVVRIIYDPLSLTTGCCIHALAIYLIMFSHLETYCIIPNHLFEMVVSIAQLALASVI